jgi:hypothetical protein
MTIWLARVGFLFGAGSVYLFCMCTVLTSVALCCADQAPKVAAQAYSLARGFHGTERGLEIAYAALYPTHQKMLEIMANVAWLSGGSSYMTEDQAMCLAHCIFPKLRDVQSTATDEFPSLEELGFAPGWAVEIPPTGSVTAPVMTAACATAKHCAKDARLILGWDMQARYLCFHCCILLCPGLCLVFVGLVVLTYCLCVYGFCCSVSVSLLCRPGGQKIPAITSTHGNTTATAVPANNANGTDR